MYAKYILGFTVAITFYTIIAAYSKIHFLSLLMGTMSLAIEVS
jgi:hypothetical protein